MGSSGLVQEVCVAGLVGVGAFCAVWGLRGWLVGKWGRDVAWMRGVRLRFNPEPGDARVWMAGYYVGFALLLGVLVALLPNIIFALLFWGLALLVPRVMIGWAWRKRLEQIDGQLPAAITALANSMRAGLTLVQAVGRLAEQAPEPVRSEFQIMANQYAYGADMDVVIRSAKGRLNLPNFNLFAAALLLNREMGGDASATLTRISKSLEKIREMHKTVEAHTSEGRTNIKVLLVAPVFMLLLMGMVDTKGVMMLFTTVPGVAVLLVAAVLAGSGAYLAGRITRSEV